MFSWILKLQKQLFRMFWKERKILWKVLRIPLIATKTESLFSQFAKRRTTPFVLLEKDSGLSFVQAFCNVSSFQERI